MQCGECGTRYDSDQNPFCPRCGSTAHGKVVPGAIPVAARHDPARRRVQASGVLLLVVGALFLVSALVGLTLPTQELAHRFVEPMADQPGGTLVLVPADDQPYNVTVTSLAGDPIANATGHVGELTIASPKHATLRIEGVHQGAIVNATAIVLTGDTLRLALADATPEEVAIGPTLETTVAVGRVVFIVVAVVLTGGGLCALLLRFYAGAATAAILGLLLSAVVLAGFLLAGLLFAIPFGFAGVFILRGRRHFGRAKTVQGP